MLLTDRPADASWLTAPQKDWLVNRIAREQSEHAPSALSNALGQALGNRRVWLLAIVCLVQSTAGIGTLIFLPLIIQSMGFSPRTTGLMATIPAAAAAALLPLWGIWTDRARTREWVAATACALMAAGLAGTALLLPSPWAILPISVALTAFFGLLAPFWTLPSSLLTGAASAVAISLVSLFGNLGQLAGPYILGSLADGSRSYTVGLALLAVLAGL